MVEGNGNPKLVFGVPADRIRCRICLGKTDVWSLAGVETKGDPNTNPPITAVIIHFFCNKHKPKDAVLTGETP